MSAGGYQISKQVKRDMYNLKNDVLDIKRILEYGNRGQAKESVSHALKIISKYVEVE